MEWHIVLFGLVLALIGWFLFRNPWIGAVAGLGFVIIGSTRD